MNSSWEKTNKKWFTSISTSWQVNCTFGTMPRSFHQQAKIFYLNVRRYQKQFQHKVFSPSYCSSGHVGCSFENPGKIFTTKGCQFFAHYQQFLREQWQKTNFMGLVFLKFRLQFWQHCRKVSAKRPHCFSSLTEDSIDDHLKNVFFNPLFLWPRRMQL